MSTRRDQGLKIPRPKAYLQYQLAQGRGRSVGHYEAYRAQDPGDVYQVQYGRSARRYHGHSDAGQLSGRTKRCQKFRQCSDEPLRKEKGACRMTAKPFFLLSFLWCRDTELNCGHGDFQATPLSFITSSNNFNYLKSLVFILANLIQYFPIFTDFGKIFSHKFSHRSGKWLGRFF